jgi:putative membrane protein
VAAFGVIATFIWFLARVIEYRFQIRIGLEVAPFEIVGAALGLLLILRTNAGYDRWWEARKLWGGIVNQSRNLAISALAYGPQDSQWRDEFIRWAAVFPHIARAYLRNQRPGAEVRTLLGPDWSERVANAQNMPSYVALKLAHLLRIACDSHGLDRWAFIQIDKERAQLIDHLGGCERILKTPLPVVYSIKIRRFIFLFLITLPFVLLHRLQSEWLIPVLTMLVAYPLLSLDHIGVELQNPFCETNLSHLPLTTISTNIERNLTHLLDEVDVAMSDLTPAHPAEPVLNRVRRAIPSLPSGAPKSA